ncbi:MAG: hypothetical protein JWL62_3605 [Hyphomicrobiales bacterium]|nr:hypothetical protein [Hyphomicrobiales bacterium]
MAQLREWSGRTGFLAMAVTGAYLLGSAAQAQYAPDIRPGDRIVYVQPDVMDRGVPMRRMAPADDGRLVYEYDGPSARERLAIDPQPVLRDLQRVQKKTAQKKKPVAQPRIAARTPASSDADVKSAPTTATPTKTALPAAAQATPVASEAAQVEAVPRADRKVRVIPLFQVPKNTTGEAAPAK